LPDGVGATTVNKVCGSGMKAIMLGHDLIVAGTAERVISGGMESMSNAPYLLTKARSGYRAGHDRLFDHMMLDGLEDAYEPGRRWRFRRTGGPGVPVHPGRSGCLCGRTLTRARAAITQGEFKAEIVPVGAVTDDEHAMKVSPEKIPQLKRPSARTARSPRQCLSQCRRRGGAAAYAAICCVERGLPILATIKSHASHAQDPRQVHVLHLPIRFLQDFAYSRGWARWCTRRAPARGWRAI